MSRKRRVTFNQLRALWEILNKNRALATGYNKSTQDREYSKRMWQDAAVSLNSQGDGAEKNWKSWCKYWNDYKSKLKSKVASARASLHITGAGPSNEGRLSDLELKYLQILGDDFGSSLPRVRVEPNSDNPTDRTGAASAPLLSANSETSDSHVAQNMESVDKLVITPKPITAASTTLPALSSPPSSSPSLPPPSAISPPPPAPRQRRRRVVPISVDTARRALVNVSEKRVKLDEKRNQILENLTLALEEIKGLLNTR